MILRQKGSWERRKNIIGALGSVSVPRREKRNTLSFYPPLLMSPWRPTSQHPGLCTSHKHLSLRRNGLVISLCPTNILNKHPTESGTPIAFTGSERLMLPPPPPHACLDSGFFEDLVLCAYSNLAQCLIWTVWNSGSSIGNPDKKVRGSWLAGNTVFTYILYLFGLT